MLGKNLSEDIIADNFPNLGKETNIQVPEAQSPKQDAPKDVTSMHTLIKMEKIKDKERVLKAAR